MDVNEGKRNRRGSYGCLIVLLFSYAVHAQQAEVVTYYYTDPQGTPLAETGGAGNITRTFDYAPYGGKVMGPSESGPGYTGHVDDPDTGFVYMQARYYDASAARFIGPDPVALKEGDLFNFNRYSYGNNNPTKYTDPTGTVVHLANEEVKLLNYVNARAAGGFGVDKDGNLTVTGVAEGKANLSETYGTDLKAAIASKDTISVSIGQTYVDPKSKETKSVDAHAGGGVTIGKRTGGDQKVTISGNANTSLKTVSGAALRDGPEDILGHELVGHAIPHLLGTATGNAVDDENKIRSEIPGSGKRALEPSHRE